MRFMLAIAIVAPLAVFILLSPWFSGRIATLPWLAVFAIGGLLRLAGVIWLIHIFSGPSEESSPWRYRGHR